MKPKTAVIILTILLVLVISGVFYLAQISQPSENEKTKNEATGQPVEEQSSPTYDIGDGTIKKETENETKEEKTERINQIIELMKETEAKSDSVLMEDDSAKTEIGEKTVVEETKEEKTERINQIIELMKETEAKSDPVSVGDAPLEIEAETAEEKAARINDLINLTKETESKSD